MKTVLKYFFTLSAIYMLSVNSAHAIIDNAASSIQLRTTCIDAAGNTINDCFDDPTALMTWIKQTRKPSLNDTLVVEIAPGNYQRIQWLCSAGEGHVSFRGAGRGRTVFTDNAILGNAMTFQNCENLTFDSMTVNARFISVVWAGSGTSTWTDVELIAGYSTWYETQEGQFTVGSVCTIDQPKNEHKFFSSTLMTKNSTIGSTIYLNNCGITWFYGSELILDATTASFSGTPVGVKSAGEGHEVHLYGSNIRLNAGSSSAVAGLTAFESKAGASVHIHGTGIDVISDKAIPVTALQAENNGAIHAAESAYVFKTMPGGTVTRINNNGGIVHAPHTWMSVPDTDNNPATIDTNFITMNAADKTVVTSNTSDGFPHPAIYTNSCPSSARWYDIVDKTCRNN